MSRAIAAGVEPSTAAALCGYADYAHLFRESTALFERSPVSFARRADPSVADRFAGHGATVGQRRKARHEDSGHL